MLDRAFLFMAVIGALLGLIACNIDILITGTTNTAATIIIATFFYGCITGYTYHELEEYLKEKYKR